MPWMTLSLGGSLYGGCGYVVVVAGPLAGEGRYIQWMYLHAVCTLGSVRVCYVIVDKNGL